MRSLNVFIGTIVLIFGLVHVAQAQMLDNVTNETITIELNPQIPTPGEEVRATLNDYSMNTQGATIRWSYDGEDQPQLINQRNISLIAPNVGESANLNVTITSPGGREMQSSVTLRPLYFDVIIEPYTFSPPFYKGRSLPIYGSQVQMTALLQGENGPINTANYTYTWRLNNQAIDGGAAQGKFQNFITIPHGRNQIVSVEVTDQSNQIVAKRVISIPISEIDVQFYENNPLYGLSQKAITNGYNLISNTTSVYAIPYNLDLNSINQNLFTEWSINNQKVAPTNNPFEITLRRQGAGSTRIAFKIRNIVELLQGDEHSVTINF